jgi:hypothetical protein
MKLTPTEIDQLLSIATTCGLAQIDAIAIADGVVRGVNEDKTCAVISDVGVPDFKGLKAGITRLSTLKARLLALKSVGDVELSYKDSGRGDVQLFEMSSGRNKATFRCAGYDYVFQSSPKSITDEPCTLVTAQQPELKLLQQALSVMGGKTITLVVRQSGEASFEVTANSDVFSVGISTAVERLVEEKFDSEVYYYGAPALMALLKAAGEADASIPFTIGRRGTLTLLVNGHAMSVIRRIQQED